MFHSFALFSFMRRSFHGSCNMSRSSSSFPYFFPSQSRYWDTLVVLYTPANTLGSVPPSVAQTPGPAGSFPGQNFGADSIPYKRADNKLGEELRKKLAAQLGMKAGEVPKHSKASESLKPAPGPIPGAAGTVPPTPLAAGALPFRPGAGTSALAMLGMGQQEQGIASATSQGATGGSVPAVGTSVGSEKNVPGLPPKPESSGNVLAKFATMATTASAGRGSESLDEGSQHNSAPGGWQQSSVSSSHSYQNTGLVPSSSMGSVNAAAKKGAAGGSNGAPAGGAPLSSDDESNVANRRESKVRRTRI